jgi:hypothetical protein
MFRVLIAATLGVSAIAGAGAVQAQPLTDPDRFAVSDLECTVVFHTATGQTTMTCKEVYNRTTYGPVLDPNG